MLSRRLSAGLLTVFLSAGDPALCLGWVPTPETRMACCKSDACPMHKRESADSGSQRTVTQAQADSCCAASERDDSRSSIPTFAATISAVVFGPAIILPTGSPAPVESHIGRPVTLIVIEPVPKHVLLSVFLV